MGRNQLSHSVFDALFERAVIDNFYEEYNALPSLEELSEEYTFSEKHEERMKALFAQEERKERFKKFVQISRKVAAVFLILVTLMTGALMLNPSVRAAVVETIISWHREFVRFTSPQAEVEGSSMIPSYIPTGFREELIEVIDDLTLILYINDFGETILFKSHKAEGALYVDNENAAYELHDLAGVTYHVLIAFYAGEENSILWEIDGWRYMLRSTIGVDSLQEIALSLD